MISVGANESVGGLLEASLPGHKSPFGRNDILRPVDESGYAMFNIQSGMDNFLKENAAEIITGKLNTLPPISLKLAHQSFMESLWDHLVSQYHYLSYQKLLGHRLKYLALMQERPVAALSFSAPSLKIGARDRFIGWSPDQRKRYLPHLANNSRFLILPWVQVPHLASHVLSLAVDQVKRDWQSQFNTPLWLLETYVDPNHFKGTSYKAANWERIGQTQGYGKQGVGYIYHGAPKEVYVYVLEPRFRTTIGCQSRPTHSDHRPLPSIRQPEELKMILRDTHFDPDIVPWMKLTETDLETMAEELVRFHEQFQDCYGRKEHHRKGLTYLSGLMSKLEAKSAEPVALEFLGTGGVRPLQRFMKNDLWDHEAMKSQHQVLLSQLLADPEAMITVDSSEFVKKGKESVGVIRQYCGALGKVENCQSGVFVGYTSKHGYGLLTSQLYLPEVWFSKAYEQRRKDTWVPEDLFFKTKIDIAHDLIQEVNQTQLFPSRWIGFDATFGSDLHFLESLPKEYTYFAAVRSNTRVFLKEPSVEVPAYSGRGPRPKKQRLLADQPGPQTVADIARRPRLRWKKVVLAEGAKGPIVADVARLRVYPSRKGLPVSYPLWLFLRRSPDGQIKYAFSNAPHDIPLSELCQAATLRWPIEQCFEEGKGQVGMDHYEHRSWPAWHRHMIYVFLALHFLTRLRIRFKKKPNADFTSSSTVDCNYSRTSDPQLEQSFGNCKIPYST
jgi:SRSO17 transposase